VQAKAAVFDETKLEWMNGVYLQKISAESLLPDVRALWEKMGFAERSLADEAYLKKVIALFRERSKMVSEIADRSRYFFADPPAYEESAVRKHFKPEAAAVLKALHDALAVIEPFDAAGLEALYRRIAADAGLAVGKLIHPTRLAVSGVSFGPGLFEMLEMLGKETVLRRLGRAQEFIAAGGTG
jgi:glutamyl/glutaminyl-tRNA synthetase